MKDIINIENLIKNEFNPCKPDKYIPIFEEKLKDFFSVKNAIAVANGTAAIHLSLAALNIKEGDPLETTLEQLRILTESLQILALQNI